MANNDHVLQQVARVRSSRQAPRIGYVAHPRARGLSLRGLLSCGIKFSLKMLVDENEGYYDEEDESGAGDAAQIVDVFAGEALPAFTLGSATMGPSAATRKQVYK